MNSLPDLSWNEVNSLGEESQGFVVGKRASECSTVGLFNLKTSEHTNDF